MFQFLTFHSSGIILNSYDWRRGQADVGELTFVKICYQSPNPGTQNTVWVKSCQILLLYIPIGGSDIKIKQLKCPMSASNPTPLKNNPDICVTMADNNCIIFTFLIYSTWLSLQLTPCAISDNSVNSFFKILTCQGQRQNVFRSALNSGMQNSP